MKALLQALGMIWRCDTASFVRRVVYVAVLSVLPLANLYVLKLLVDSVTGMSARTGTVVYLLAVYVGVFLMTRLVGALSGVNNDLMTQRLTDYMSGLMQRQSSRLDMAYYDNPAYHDTYHRAQQESGYRPLQVLNGFMGLFGSVIGVTGIVAILSSASWWIIVVMLVALTPSFVVQLKKSKRIYAFHRNNTQEYRRIGYYASILGTRAYAQEVRLLGLANYFRKRYLTHRKALVKRLMRISYRLAEFDVLSAMVESAALFGVLYYLIMGTVSGGLTVGSFVMLFEAYRRGHTQFATLVGSVSTLYDNRLFLANLFEFLNLEPTVVSPEKPEPFPERIESVEFRDITFRYPGMDYDVLSHFDLKAKAGEVTLVEGRNGFGKTTLLKLLMRLYDPNGGAVLINGMDVRCYDLGELRNGIGAIFQDFVRFYCTATENIAFGDIEKMEDGVEDTTQSVCAERNALTLSVREAARRAGADEYIGRLPKGYDTQLGRMFDDGQELSMGQWQRMALARQLYRDAPIMLFDEPMAWQDKESRKHIGETIASLKNEKKVIIIVNHV